MTTKKKKSRLKEFINQDGLYFNFKDGEFYARRMLLYMDYGNFDQCFELAREMIRKSDSDLSDDKEKLMNRLDEMERDF